MAVTVSDVSHIFDTDLDSDEIAAMLATAESLIATHIDPLSDSRVTSSVRDEIKKWLGAHFCAIKDPQVKEESADGVRLVFHGKSTMGLNATMYGQQALLIDPTGKLKRIEEGAKPLNYHFSSPRATTTDP